MSLLSRNVQEIEMEPTTGVEPVNLFLTKEVLYLLSYVGLQESGNMHDWRRIFPLSGGPSSTKIE